VRHDVAEHARDAVAVEPERGEQRLVGGGEEDLGVVGSVHWRAAIGEYGGCR
jgi:hypothetical protein